MSGELEKLLKGMQFEDYKLELQKNEISEAFRTKRVCPQCNGNVCPTNIKGWQVCFDEEASVMYKFPMFKWNQCEKYKG